MKYSPSFWVKRPRSARLFGRFFVALEGDAAEAIALALFDRDEDVDALAGRGPKREWIDAAGVADLGGGLAGEGLEEAAILVGELHAADVLIELARVVGLGEEVLKNDGVRDADGLEVLHRGDEGAIGHGGVAGQRRYLPTLTVGPSLILKVRETAAGGMVFTSQRTVANWCPCSERSSLRTTTARVMLAGLYWLSTEMATLAFLKRSRTSGLRDGIEGRCS